MEGSPEVRLGHNKLQLQIKNLTELLEQSQKDVLMKREENDVLSQEVGALAENNSQKDAELKEAARQREAMEQTIRDLTEKLQAQSQNDEQSKAALNARALEFEGAMRTKDEVVQRLEQQCATLATETDSHKARSIELQEQLTSSHARVAHLEETNMELTTRCNFKDNIVQKLNGEAKGLRKEIETLKIAVSSKPDTAEIDCQTDAPETGPDPMAAAAPTYRRTFAERGIKKVMR